VDVECFLEFSVTSTPNPCSTPQRRYPFILCDGQPDPGIDLQDLWKRLGEAGVDAVFAAAEANRELVLGGGTSWDTRIHRKLQEAFLFYDKKYGYVIVAFVDLLRFVRNILQVDSRSS
jgi:hypothetical protein